LVPVPQKKKNKGEYENAKTGDLPKAEKVTKDKVQSGITGRGCTKILHSNRKRGTVENLISLGRTISELKQKKTSGNFVKEGRVSLQRDHGQDTRKTKRK